MDEKLLILRSTLKFGDGNSVAVRKKVGEKYFSVKTSFSNDVAMCVFRLFKSMEL